LYEGGGRKTRGTLQRIAARGCFAVGASLRARSAHFWPVRQDIFFSHSMKKCDVLTDGPEANPHLWNSRCIYFGHFRFRVAVFV